MSSMMGLLLDPTAKHVQKGLKRTVDLDSATNAS